MATHNPPGLYTFGAVELNSQPSVNVYAQHLQRRQAREEALDNYEMNRINRMNEAGVRDIDRPGLDSKVIDMKSYYQANKDKIRKGGTPEAYNYEKMFRDTLAGVSKSKNATARAETFNKIRLERQKLGRNTPEDWFLDYTTHEDTPIWDEKFTELDLPKYMSQNQVKYDPKKSIDLFKDIKRTPGSPRYEDIPGDPYSRNKFIDETFDKDSKMTIAARASDLYDSNDGFAMSVQEDFNNPIKRGELEKISIEEFGTAPQSMSDYAAAKMLQQLQPKVTGKPTKEEDWFKKQAQMQKWKEKNIQLSSWLRGISKDENTPFDLTNYPKTEDGQYDITAPLKGVSVVRTKSGASFPSTSVLYNPTTGNFQYLDPIERKVVIKPFTQFIQDIKTNNPNIDVKFLQTLGNPVDRRSGTSGRTGLPTGESTKPKTENKPKGKYD